jgi:molybdopterin converting factor small subunit
MSLYATLTIRMFGVFKNHHPSHITLQIPDGSQVSAIKAALAEQLQQQSPNLFESDWLNQSVLANDQRILSPDEFIHGNATLAILPPVCGG